MNGMEIWFYRNNYFDLVFRSRTGFAYESIDLATAFGISSSSKFYIEVLLC